MAARPTPLIVDSLRRTAQRLPAKKAIGCDEESYTFAAFDEIADRVAGFLAEHGVRRGDRVGIGLPKCGIYVPLQFGVLRAGAAYVPVDHAFPADRIDTILADCGIQVFFTTATLWKRLRESGSAVAAGLRAVVIVDGAAEPEAGPKVLHLDEVRAADRKAPDVTILDSDLAYVMYTSGSTGKPKGVMVTHRNINVFMDWCRPHLRLTEEDRIVNTAPFTFDISGLDTFNAVDLGASLFIVRDQSMVNMVFATIHKERITFCSTVPTVIGAIVNQPIAFKRYDLSCLHTVVSGAAVCPPVFMKKLHEFLPKARLVNIYGPTEATIYCMYHEVDGATVDVDKPLPIGIPFENTDAFVVDAEGKEAAPGASGELILRGGQIAAGYFGNEEKTVAAFKNFPLLPHLNEKVYFTGDVATRDERGVFTFLGRKDDMIKSRGYRIELNEIELALDKLDGVVEHGVVAVPDELIENVICAAIVVKDRAADWSTGKVRELLHGKLPDYMRPDHVFVFDALPQTTSGKISRKDILRRIVDEKLIPR